MAVNTKPKRVTLQSITKIVFFLVCLTVVLPLLAAQPASEADQDVPTLEVFVRDACPHCAAAKAFLPEFSVQRPWLRIVLRAVNVDPAAHFGYLGLYMVGYIADDRIMVGTAVMALSSQKLSENAGRWLKLVSGLVMLALGGVMLLRPDWLF